MKTLWIALLACCFSSVYCKWDIAKMLENMPCVQSKVVVEEKPDLVIFKIVTDGGVTLFDVNSKNTNKEELDNFLSELRMLLFPPECTFLKGNTTDYYITQWKTDTGGTEVMLVSKAGPTVFRKTFHEPMVTELGQIGCAHIYGFDLIIDPAWDIKKLDGYNMTSLLWSCSFGLSDVAKSLLKKGADLHQASGSGLTPLMAAICSNSDDLVELFIQKGAKVDGKYSAPLHKAASYGRNNAVKMLIAHGADVNARSDPDGMTALHFAALDANAKTVELLIGKGADVNVKDNEYGRTPLHFATMLTFMLSADNLLKAGADLNALDKEGNTPLMLAVNHYDKEEPYLLEAVKFLLKHYNPDLTVRNKNGDTALSMALKRGHSKIAELLKAKGAVA